MCSPESKLTNPPGHLWRDKWTARPKWTTLSNPDSYNTTKGVLEELVSKYSIKETGSNYPTHLFDPAVQPHTLHPKPSTLNPKS